MGLDFDAKKISIFISYTRSYLNFSINHRYRLQRGLKNFFEDSINNVVNQKTVEPAVAVHVIHVFQDSVPLI
jgi:hypothetical protein